MTKLLTKVASVGANIAVRAAKISADVPTGLYAYQPKMPKDMSARVKTMKK